MKESAKLEHLYFAKKTGKILDVDYRDFKFSVSECFKVDAIGSGHKHAITALDLGCSAVEAIRMTIKRDACTGGIIRCFDTKTCKFVTVKQ
jgi:hypothetical protein